ncbi:hypothetical protein [Streptomyces sp. BPTC-684]|uniref:hypothetical protein n=1 Tax=Streptomyces sp. BPTC-684 TaxID=3043734 RepID=UPI0024B1807F|nr:hypothetical protein [Streptomyces sp. BPTC-684]WHM36052.1 hypothetical protein QIY60_03355 [Streptomyces sp. BPTC-684]
MGDKPDTGTKQDERRLDLSVPQVAGSALAAIAAAVLASKLGVYGTILGAGVVSVVATCGGTVFQHLFRRTGEQLRDVTVQSLPKARRDPDLPAYEDTREGEFGAATVHGTRLRGWKRSALGAAVVFAVAMGGITAYELASGGELGGGKGGTTFGSVVSGSGGGGKPSRKDSEKDSEPGRRTPHTPGTGADGGTSPSPDPAQGTVGTPATGGASGTGGTTPTPTPTPSTSTGGTPSPPPSPPPSTGSGSATPDTGSAAGSAATPPAP